MTAEPKLSLRRGKDLTAWPWIKLRMTVAMLDALAAEIDIWNLEHPFIASPRLSEDRLTIELRVTEVSAPPVIHWAACLGNAIGSLRSAADAFAWEIAHLHDNVPENPSRVYFPTSANERVWNDQVKNLGNLHPDLQDRFRELKTFQDGQWRTVITSIAKLNNIDKHRSWLQISPQFEQASLDGLNVQLDPQHGGSQVVLEPCFSIEEVTVDTVAARLRFSSPVEGASGQLRGTIAPVLSTETAKDVGFDGSALMLVANMRGALAYGFEHLCYGDLQASDFSNAAPVPGTYNWTMKIGDDADKPRQGLD